MQCGVASCGCTDIINGCKGIALFGSHTSAKKVSIERDKFKVLEVTNLKDLLPEQVLEAVLRQIST